MKSSFAKTALPLHVRRTLKGLGRDISIARKIRSITLGDMAERASIARSTYQRIEEGDPSVSLGAYAMVLFVLGLGDRLNQLADPGTDLIALQLTQETLPKRIAKPKKPRAL
jgi:transcriptional regulator with XRE-family HTH domain